MGRKVDVAIHIRGIVDLKPVVGALNLVWLISHPDKLLSADVQMADALFVPSDIARDAIQRRFGIDSQVMPQATDPRRFAFQEQISIPALAERLLFIGNSRRQPRRIVMDSVELRLPVDIYGGDWQFYVGKEVVRGTYVRNDDLAGYYRSARCVLNDHWATMASHGIVSNRLFDVTAAGGIAISDEVAGIDDLFRGHVRTYRTREDLAALVATLPDWIPSVEARRDLSRAILEQHSFDARARQFIDFIHAFG